MSNERDEELRDLVSCLVGYGTAAGLDVAALLLAALCYLGGGEPFVSEASPASGAVPDNYYPH